MNNLDCLTRPTLQGGRLVSSVRDSLGPVTGPVASNGTSTLGGTMSAALANHEACAYTAKVVDVAGRVRSPHQQSDVHAHLQHRSGGAVNEDPADPWVMKRMNFGAKSLSQRRGRAPHLTSASTLQSGTGRFSFM